MTATTRRSRVVAGPRLAARADAGRRERRRRRVQRAGFGALALLPLAALAWLLLWSPVLAVDQVRVTGTMRTTPQQVVALADVPRGTPLARVDVAAARDRVLRAAPVADATVERVWPGTLAVRVLERRAVAAVALPDRRWRLVDGTGVPFAVDDALPQGAVRLLVPSPGPAPDSPATTAALRVLADLPAGLRERVERVQATSASSVELALRGGRTVVWGAPGSTATKGGAVEALLRRPGRVLDVSAPTVVVVRP